MKKNYKKIAFSIYNFGIILFEIGCIVDSILILTIAVSDSTILTNILATIFWPSLLIPTGIILLSWIIKKFSDLIK